MEKEIITKSEFNKYKDVQESGKYNMLDPKARQETSLDREKWIYILKNYSDLNNKYSQGE